MKSAAQLVLLVILTALVTVTPTRAQLFYPSSQLLKARKAKLIVTGEVIYRGKIHFSLSTHPGSQWQTIVFKTNEVLKGEEKGKYLRVAFFTDKELSSFSKGDKLLLVLDDMYDGGCGENDHPVYVEVEKGQKIDLKSILSKKPSDNGNSPAFKEYETSSCFYAYPAESAFEASNEEVETMRIFLRALNPNN